MDVTPILLALQVHFQHASVSSRQYILGNLVGTAYDLPYNGCCLIYLPWPENIAKPTFDVSAQYNDIFVHGRDVTQPRRTLCYGESYRYSGTNHKLEPITPPEIQMLMDITRRVYDPEEKMPLTMMCLANWYQTGRHCISSHSDKEGQFSAIRDIWCWVVGAPRRIIIRTRKEITNGKEVQLLSVSIPEGVYIMAGEMFQRTYKHEIPQEKEAMFGRLCKIVPAGVIGELACADWLAANPDEVRRLAPGDFRDYLEWSRARNSYTNRFFAK